MLGAAKVSNFLWPFKLSSPKGGFINKRWELRSRIHPSTLCNQDSHWLRSFQVMASVKLVGVTGATARRVMCKREGEREFFEPCDRNKNNNSI